MKHIESTTHEPLPGTQRSLQQQREEAVAESEQKLIAACTGITAELEERKTPFTSQRDWGGRYSIKVQAPDEGLAAVEIEIKSEHTSRSFHPKVEKVRIIVGRYSNKRQFLERKAGFDFKEIVDSILERFERAKFDIVNNRQHAARRELLETQAARIHQQVGTIPSTMLRVLHSGGLRIETDNLNEDQALAVMQLLQSFHKGTP